VFIWHGLHKRRFEVNAVGLAMAALWVLLMIRVVVDISLTQKPMGGYLAPEEYYTYIPSVIFTPLLAFWVRSNVETLHRARRVAFWLTLAGAPMIAVLSLQNRFTKEIGRMTMGTLSPITIGHYGVALLILSMAMGLDLKQSRWWRIAALPGAALALFFILGSESRGAQAAAAISMGVYLLMGLRGRKRLAVAILILLPLVAAAPVFVSYLAENSGIHVFSRWQDDGERDDMNSSAGVRRYLAERCWEEFRAHPLAGSGMVDPSTTTMPHNVVLEALMATGFVGGLLWFGIYIGACRRAVLICSRTPSLAWIGVLLFQQIVNGMVSGSLFLDAGLWCWAAAVVLAYKIGGGSPRAGIRALRRARISVVPDSRLIRTA